MNILMMSALLATTFHFPFHLDDSFEAKRRDLWRDPSGEIAYANRLDFAKREVRDHYVAELMKAAATPGVDAIELDTIEAGLVLTPGRERELHQRLTDFVSTMNWKLNDLAKNTNKPRVKLIAKAAEKNESRHVGFYVHDWQGGKYVDEVNWVKDVEYNFNGKPRNVPALMKTFAGKAITTQKEWEKVRKPEIKDFFLKEIYGRRPGEKPAKLEFSLAEPDKVMMDGKAIRKRIRVSYGDKCGESSFVFTAFIPADATADKPAPTFMLICNRDPKANLDPERVVKSGFWPAEQIVERGYAAIAFFNGDVALDYDWGYNNGVYTVFQKPEDRNNESWGILSAWSWGASRVMDWIESEKSLDAKHVAVVGHSRGGKTSLFTGVYDERFAMTCVNCSGCGGTKLNHISLPRSEHYDQIWNAIGCWFCNNFEKYVYHEDEVNFDAHEWMALIAPRLLAVASASEDAWAGQEGEYYSCAYASPAWELYGKRGLVTAGFPGADKPEQEGSISYHMRTGEHNLTPYDWDCYMDFADKHGWRNR